MKFMDMEQLKMVKVCASDTEDEGDDALSLSKQLKNTLNRRKYQQGASSTAAAAELSAVKK